MYPATVTEEDLVLFDPYLDQEQEDHNVNPTTLVSRAFHALTSPSRTRRRRLLRVSEEARLAHRIIRLDDMDQYASLFSTSGVKYNVFSADTPLRLPGWHTWALKQLTYKTAQPALRVVSGTHLSNHDLKELTAFMKEFVRMLAILLTTNYQAHFAGWFPSALIYQLGLPLPLELLETALSLTLMYPVHPLFLPYRAVHAVRILNIPVSADNCCFVSLHPSLYIVS